MQLKGKTVYITGGTGGIGRPLVSLLRQHGAQVICYERSRDGELIPSLDKLCAELKQNTPDILINMAGFNEFSYAEDQDFKSLLDINLLVPMRLTKAVLPGMKNRGSGHIVNIGSMTGLIPLPHLTGYVAAKAGLKGFTDALRRELQGTDIIVTHIVPRAVNTAMNKGIKAELNQQTGVQHDDPEKIAFRILNAILKKEKEVRIGWPERLFALLHALFPRIIDKGLNKNRLIGEAILNNNTPHGESS